MMNTVNQPSQNQSPQISSHLQQSFRQSLDKLRHLTTIVQQQTEMQITQLRIKSKQQKKKERKKKNKLEKIEREKQAQVKLRQILRKVYENNDTYNKYKIDLQQISQQIENQNMFLTTHNIVKAEYVEKTLIDMDNTFTYVLTSQGIVDEEQLLSYDQLFYDRPQIFKKLTDFLYNKFIQICRAGTNAFMVLKCLKIDCDRQRLESDYEYLDKEIFKQLIEYHEQFKSFINYAYKVLNSKIKPSKPISEQTLDRMREIIKVIQFTQQQYDYLQEYKHDSDHSTQQSDLKSQAKKNKKRNKKKKNKAKIQNELEQQSNEILSIEQLTLIIINNINENHFQQQILVSDSFLQKYQI